MQKPSSPSVKVIYYNRDRVAKALAQTLQELAGRHPEVEEVVLFGSFVRGDAVPGSDVDMLLILRDSPDDFLKRIPTYLPTTVPGGVDLFPYTRQEIERMTSEGNPFLRRALAEGRHFTRQEILSGKMALPSRLE